MGYKIEIKGVRGEISAELKEALQDLFARAGLPTRIEYTVKIVAVTKGNGARKVARWGNFHEHASGISVSFWMQPGGNDSARIVQILLPRSAALTLKDLCAMLQKTTPQNGGAESIKELDEGVEPENPPKAPLEHLVIELDSLANQIQHLEDEMSGLLVSAEANFDRKAAADKAVNSLVLEVLRLRQELHSAAEQLGAAEIEQEQATALYAESEAAGQAKLEQRNLAKARMGALEKEIASRGK